MFDDGLDLQKLSVHRKIKELFVPVMKSLAVTDASPDM
jgi:hypothetical protein